MPFVIRFDAFAKQLNEAHPHMIGRGDIKILRKSHAIIFINEC